MELLELIKYVMAIIGAIIAIVVTFGLLSIAAMALWFQIGPWSLLVCFGIVCVIIFIEEARK